MKTEELKLDSDQLECIKEELDKFFNELSLLHDRVDSISIRWQYVLSFFEEPVKDSDLPF